MFGPVLEKLRLSPSKNDPKPTNIEKNKSRKREIVDEDQPIDVLQTPPSKRSRNKEGSGATSFFSVLLANAMDFTRKYNSDLWSYVVGGKKKDNLKKIVTIDLEAENDDEKERKTSDTDQDLLYLGTISRNISITEDKQRSRYTAPRQTKEEKSGQSKTSSLSDSIRGRKPLHLSRRDKTQSLSYIQQSTPLQQPDTHQVKSHIPVFTIPDEPSPLPVMHSEWKSKAYDDRNYEETRENRTSNPNYHRAPEAPKPLTHQQKSSLPTVNNAFLSNFNVSQKPASSSLQGKIRVRHTKESPRRPAPLRRYKNTARYVVRLEEMERYKLLLSQFTSCTSGITVPDISSVSNKENSVISISSNSYASEKNSFAAKPPETTYTRKLRSLEESVLSPRSSLYPRHQTQSIQHSTPLSPVSHPTVLKATPSTAKTFTRSDHVEDLPLHSKQESFGPLNQRTMYDRTTQPLPEVDEILSGSWTKKWKDILSPDNYRKERQSAKIAREEEKLHLMKDMRRQEQEKALERVKERIRKEEEIEEEEELEEEEEADLVPLTEEMQREVDRALGPGNPSETLADGFKISITRGDMATLSNLNWLNDEIINIYFSLIADRSKSEGYPKVHTFNSFFYPKLIKSGYDSLKRWTRRVDIFAMDMIIVPIHLGMHWCLAVIDFRSKTIKYFDSLKGTNNQCLDALQKYLAQESMDKKKVPYNTSDWSLSCPKDIPEQLNGCDCGVFACTYAEFLTRDAKFTFNQHHMPYFRRRMVYEILKMKLL